MSTLNGNLMRMVSRPIARICFGRLEVWILRYAELRADLTNLYGRDPGTRQPYISNAVSLRPGGLSAKRSLRKGDCGP